MIFLFGGRKVSCDYVMAKDLYEQLKAENKLYTFKEQISPKDEKAVCAVFKTSESFLKDALLSEKDLMESEKISNNLAILPQEASELFLAKKLGAILIISSRQLWLENAAKKFRVKTMTFK